MGSRHSRRAGKENANQDGKVVERSDSKRGSGRKKKKEAQAKVGDGTGNNVASGKKKTANETKKKETKKKVAVTKSVDEVDTSSKRPKIGRLSGSFAAGETRSVHKDNFSAIDDVRGSAPKSAELKVYRSYSSLADDKRVTMFDAEPSLAQVKLYRKAPQTVLSPSHRAMSLPRGFGRTRSALAEPSNGNAGGRRDLTDHAIWENKRASTSAVRSATMPRLHSGVSTSSAAGYRVSTDNFPQTAFIERKLKQFESMFVKSLLAKYSRLTPREQLATVPVVIRRGRANQHLTVLDYLQYPDLVPDDVVDRTASDDFVLCIPTAITAGMSHFRREHGSNADHWPTLSRDVVTCVAAESAAEISRMFEYQIALLTGETSINLLADHCAERVISYIMQDLQVPRLDRNTVIQGAVRGKRPVVNPQQPTTSPVFISVIIGMKELKWNLLEIFDKPGLRKDVLLTHDTVPAPGDDDRCPWKFYTSPSSDPMLYGYRGQLLEWDFIQGLFRLNSYDEASFSEEMSWRYDDFHRLYPPYRRLFGSRAMKRYYSEQARADAIPIHLDRFLKQAVHGLAYARDVIQPVYRPLEPFTLAEVDGVDLSNADVPRALLPKKTGRYGSRSTLSPSGERPVFTPSYSEVPFYTPGVVNLNSSTASEPRWMGYTLVKEEVTTVHAHKASHV